MSTRIGIIHRIIIAIAIQVQAVDGFGIQVSRIIRANESAPLGGVIPGVAIVEAGIAVVVVATVTDWVGIGNIIAGSLAGDSAIAPGVVQILSLQRAVGIVDGYHIALQVLLEIVGVGSAAHGVDHTNDGAFVIQEDNVLVGSTFAVNGFADVFRPKITVTNILHQIIRPSKCFTKIKLAFSYIECYDLSDIEKQ